MNVDKALRWLLLLALPCTLACTTPSPPFERIPAAEKPAADASAQPVPSDADAEPGDAGPLETRAKSAMQGMIIGCVVGGYVGGPYGAAAGSVVLGLYGLATGKAFGPEGGQRAGDNRRGDAATDAALEREIDEALAGNESLEDEIDEELRRQAEELAALDGPPETDEPSRDRAPSRMFPPATLDE
jgi:hypothetical protein